MSLTVTEKQSGRLFVTVNRWDAEPSITLNGLGRIQPTSGSERVLLIKVHFLQMKGCKVDSGVGRLHVFKLRDS